MADPRRNYYKYARTAGGAYNANVDGSSTPVDFFCQAPPSEKLAIHRVMIHIEDNANLAAEDYGGVAGPLTNGIEVVVEDGDGNELIDITDGVGIVSVSAWGRVCYDVAEHTFGAGNNFLNVRWTFAKSGFPVNLDSGEKIIFRIRDNLSTLVEHTFMCQGHYR